MRRPVWSDFAETWYIHAFAAFLILLMLWVGMVACPELNVLAYSFAAIMALIALGAQFRKNREIDTVRAITEAFGRHWWKQYLKTNAWLESMETTFATQFAMMGAQGLSMEYYAQVVQLLSQMRQDIEERREWQQRQFDELRDRTDIADRITWECVPPPFSPFLEGTPPIPVS